MVVRAAAVVVVVDFVVAVGVVVAPALASKEVSSIVGLFVVPCTLSLEDMCQRQIVDKYHLNLLNQKSLTSLGHCRYLYYYYN